MAGDVTRDLTVKELSSGSGSQDGSWSIDHILDRADGTSLLLERSAEDGAKVLAFLGPDGKLTEVTTVADVGDDGFDAAPVGMPGGKRCAVYLVVNGILHLACDDGTVEDSKVAVDGSDYGFPVLPIVGADGTLSVFATSQASFTVVERSPSGQWSEIERHESSISFPTDVALHGGAPVACFISAGGYAVITAREGTITSAEKARDCRVAVDDSSVHVWLDTGFATIPGRA